MPAARLIIDPPAPGHWNMAVDEALLRTAAGRGAVTLRIYRWQEPTLSLGYFQPYHQRQEHSASRACPVVRRASGGGAIVHDRELTYSLSGPIADRLAPQVARWYEHVHQGWVNALARFGVQAHLCTASPTARPAPFLCFQRRTAGDLLVDRWKIGGSAQRRHRHAALQHGSLLIDQSPAAPELPGLAQLAPAPLDVTRWQEAWIEQLGSTLGVGWMPAELDVSEREMAAELAREMFAARKWALRR